MQPGVKIGESYTDWSEGAMKGTDNTFDMALSTYGFFEIEYTDKGGLTSTKYTRDGSFTLELDGTLVTKDGDYVLDTSGNHITLNPIEDAYIDRQGNIYQGNNQLVAQIAVTDFEDYNYLLKYGENMYDAIAGAVEVPSQAQVLSGYLEQSNVDIVSEMVQMISVQRHYEANQKVIQTMDDSLDKSVNDIGRLQ